MPELLMTDEDFDAAVVAAAFDAIAQHGWHGLNLAAAARDAGLDIGRARSRIGSRAMLLRRFGALADRAALGEDAPGAPIQERLFDMLMRRFDVMQSHRAGVVALLKALPGDPVAALTLAAGTLGSMRWLLDAAGVPAGGPLGLVRAEGLAAVWLWTVRSWLADQSPDLSATMAALDAALDRAAQIARMLPGAAVAPPVAEPGSG